MCLDGVRGSKKKKEKKKGKKLVEAFEEETENLITFGGLSGENPRPVFNIGASFVDFQQLLTNANPAEVKSKKENCGKS